MDSPGRCGSDRLAHLREVTEQARIAFEDAREAFLELEAAHQEGRPGIEESADFQAKLDAFRKAAALVHVTAQAPCDSHPPS